MNGRGNKAAAKILRGLKDEIEQVHEAVNEEGVPNILRSASSRLRADDEASASTAEGSSFTFDSSNWDGGDEW